MLNLFPTMWLSLLAYSILRIVLGSIFLFICRRHLTQIDMIAHNLKLPIIHNGRITLGVIIVTEAIIGGLLLLGLLTQFAAILAIALSIKTLIWYKRFPKGSIPERMTYILIIAIALSLFITGAGFFAFDLPI